jgi:hypothetical protein
LVFLIYKSFIYLYVGEYMQLIHWT